MSMTINLVEDHNIYLCEGGPVYNGGVQPTPITYLTQWKIVGNSEVHTNQYLTSWKVSGNSVVQDGSIMSCGDLGQDGKYHVKISNGVTIFDIPLTEPLRKVNDVADTIEFPSETDGKALVTRNIYKSLLTNGNWYIPKSGIVASTSWRNDIKVTNAATNVIAEGFTQAVYGQLKNSSYGVGASAYNSDTQVIVGLYDSSFIDGDIITQDFYDYISNKEIQFIRATPTTELVDAPQIAEAESYTCVISQGGKAVSWSSFETNSE